MLKDSFNVVHANYSTLYFDLYVKCDFWFYRVLLDGNTRQDFPSMNHRQMLLRVLGASMEYRRTGRMRLTQVYS